MKKAVYDRFVSRAVLLLILMLLGVLLAYVLTVLIAMVFQGGSLAEALNAMSSSMGCLLLMQGLQTLLAFALPPVLLAHYARRPVRLFLNVRLAETRTSAGLRPADFLLAVLSIVVASPLINWLVSWNETWHLPACLSALEEVFRTMEDNAADVTELLTGGTTCPRLLLNLAVIAALPGLAEELLFRGAILRIVGEGLSVRRSGPDRISRRSMHLSIWLTAILFSAMHFQFFGFLPRMLLGAWLGYLLYWTGSLWVPIVAHFTNNAISVVLVFAANRSWIPESFGDSFGTGSQWWMSLISAVLLALIAYCLRNRISFSKRL